MAGRRQSAAKSGTWENGKKNEDGTRAFPKASAHAWYVGYTEQLATAIWVGSKDHNGTPIKDTKGNNIFGAGLPGNMWEAFMDQAHKEMQLPNRKMTVGTSGRLGDPNKGELKPGDSPSSTEPHKPRPTKKPRKPTL